MSGKMLRIDQIIELRTLLRCAGQIIRQTPQVLPTRGEMTDDLEDLKDDLEDLKQQIQALLSITDEWIGSYDLTPLTQSSKVAPVLNEEERISAKREILQEYRHRMQREPACQRVNDESMQVAAHVLQTMLDELFSGSGNNT